MKTYQLIVHTQATVLNELLKIEGWRHYLPKYLGFSIKENLTLFKDEQMKKYYETRSLRQFAHKLKQKIETNSRFQSKIKSDAQKACQKLIQTSKHINKTVGTSTSNRQLKKLWQAYIQSTVKWSPFLAIPNPYEKIIETELKQEIFGDNVDQIVWQKLTSLPKQPALIQEQHDLLKLAYRRKKGQPINLYKHWQRYCWLSCYNPNDPPMKLDHFNGRLNKLLQQPLNDLKQKLEISIKKTKENEIHYHNALKKLKIITTTKQKLDFLRYLTYLKTFRMEAHMQSFYYTQPLTRQICKQNNLTQSQLNLLTLTEINQLLLGTIKPQSINFSERKHAVVHRINSQIDVHFGKPAYKAFKQKTKASTRDPKNSISGNPASLGKVVGRARIVTQKNINQLQQGEILVASMTNPSFLPAMSKAVAFVTDEGGVLCHAAIVAREMEKPCIVGTGNATQRIKTGDIVLVDANSGDVHLLKKDDQKPNHLK